MQIYDMGRVTVRDALALLRSKKIIDRFPRRGSVVLDPKLAVGIRSLDSIREVVQLGMQTKTRVTHWGPVKAQGASAVFFGVSQKTVFELRGVRHRAAMPVYGIASTIRKDIGERIDEKDLTEHTPIELIMDTMRIPVVHADEEVWAETADASLAKQLKLTKGSVVIVEQRRLYSKNSLPLVLATTWWRSDQYRRLYRIAH